MTTEPSAAESDASTVAEPNPDLTVTPEIEALIAYVTSFGDVVGNPADVAIQSVCRNCAATTFWMEVSEEDGVAKRTCTGCKQTHFIGDSEEHWAEADTGDAACPCGTKVFEVAVGYCLGDGGHVTWMIVGGRCTKCGDIGIYSDWSIDYEPSKQLLEMS